MTLRGHIDINIFRTFLAILNNTVKLIVHHYLNTILTLNYTHLRVNMSYMTHNVQQQGDIWHYYRFKPPGHYNEIDFS